MIVEGFDRKIVFPGHFTDGSQDDRRQAVCLRHVRHRAANATVAVISFQSSLAPFIGSGEQLDYPVHLAHALVESEPDTIERQDRKSTRLNSSHRCISYAVFCLKKKK